MKKLLLTAFILFAGFFAFSYDAEAAITKAPNNLGLIGYWSFDEGTSTIAHDFSGNKHNGTLTSISAPATASSGWGVGKYSSGIIFDGTNDYIQINSTLGITGYPLTISAWIRTSQVSTASTQAQIFALTSSASNGVRKGVSIVASTTCIVVSNASRDCGSTIINDGRWHHIVGVYTSDTSRTLYVDASVEKTGSSLASYDATIDRASIGTEWDQTPGSWFGGTIDDVRVYTRALSVADIAALYESGTQKINTGRMDEVANGLVGYWTMDGKDTNWNSNKMVDVSGSRNVGTLVGLGTTTSTQQGKLGQALVFNGVSSNIQLNYNALDITGQITISSWIKPSTVSGGPYEIYQRGDWNIGHGIAVVSGSIRDNNNISAGTIVAGKWQHVVKTFDGSTTKIYVNGAQVISVATGGATSTASISGIGAEYHSNPSGRWFFNGSIDEVRVYNRALSTTEIKQLYNMGADVKINVSNTSGLGTGINSGLVHHWTFDGKDTKWNTNTVNDIVADKNGTLNNMSTSSSPVQGRVGQGLFFNQNGNSSVVANNAGFNGTKTIAFWAYNATSSSVASLYSSSGNFYIRKNNAGIQMNFVTSTTTILITTNATISNVWRHFAFTFDTSGGNVVITSYQNGVQVGQTSNVDMGNEGTTVRIGASSTFPTSFCWVGGMDDVRVYNRVLSAAEIKQLYNMGK